MNSSRSKSYSRGNLFSSYKILSQSRSSLDLHAYTVTGKKNVCTAFLIAGISGVLLSLSVDIAVPILLVPVAL